MNDIIRILMQELDISEATAIKYLIRAVRRELWMDRQERIMKELK